MVYIVRGKDMCETSAMFEELSITEIDIYKRSAAEYIAISGLVLIDDIPLSSRCNTIPSSLFIENFFNTNPGNS